MLPRYTERFHVEMRKGRVVFTPSQTEPLLIGSEKPALSVPCGIDWRGRHSCMESLGWKAEIVLEHVQLKPETEHPGGT